MLGLETLGVPKQKSEIIMTIGNLTNMDNKSNLNEDIKIERMS